MALQDSKKIIGGLINLITLISLASLAYGILPGASEIFNWIVVFYTVLLTIAIITSGIVIAFLLLYMFTIKIAFKDTDLVIDFLKTYYKNNMSFNKIDESIELILQYDKNDLKINEMKSISNRLNNIHYRIYNYFFTISISLMAFNLGMIYLFIIEVTSLIIIEVLYILINKVLDYNNKILYLQKEIIKSQQSPQ